MNIINVLTKIKEIRQCIENYKEIKDEKYLNDACLCLDELFEFFSNKLNNMLG
jgi:hypothetical protein